MILMSATFGRLPAAPTLSTGSALRGWAKRFSDLARARRANRDLIRRTADMHYMDDRMLEDIGLTHDDLLLLELELVRRR
jgi:uncharacterized protein YjiS (DUF1127 family)